jgi:hypothetical protein
MKNVITDTGVPGCAIQYEKNHMGMWCAFPLITINEQCDGLKSNECILFADALRNAAEKIRILNSNEETKMLFEGGN